MVSLFRVDALFYLFILLFCCFGLLECALCCWVLTCVKVLLPLSNYFIFLKFLNCGLGLNFNCSDFELFLLNFLKLDLIPVLCWCQSLISLNSYIAINVSMTTIKKLQYTGCWGKHLSILQKTFISFLNVNVSLTKRKIIYSGNFNTI